MKYLICLDLDGCVLSDEKTVSQELIDTIKLCKQNGCIIAFNTTRNFNRVKKYLPLLEPDYTNCLCGCLVRKSNGEELFNKKIPSTELQKVFNILNNYKELNLACSEWTDEEFVTDKDYAKRHNKKCLNKEELQKIDSYKLIYLFENNIDEKILNKIRQLDLNITLSQKNKYLRIMPNQDKWNGIEIILKDLNIDNLKIISFGNDHTDIQTIKNSHVGVAMINSTEELLSVAKNITEFNNNESGIAKYLKNYLKKEGVI